MRRTGRGGARRALALVALALVACLCAGAAFATGGERGASDFASGVNDVPALAAEQDAGQQGGRDASGSEGDGSDQAGSGLQLSKTAVYDEDEGDYTVTLEAYATGSSTTTVVKDGADIVLMLDLSDYMYGTKTDTAYDYTGVASDTRLRNLSTDENRYWYLSDGAYHPVTVTSQGGRVTVAYDDGSGNNVLINGGEYDRLSSYPDVTLYTRSESTATVPDTDNDDKLAVLKTAVGGFIDKVRDEAPASRIAIVTYADGAVVESGSKSAEDEALVTVDEAGAAALQAIVNDLAVRGGASNSHYAAADAVKIFQAVPADSPEYERQRFALLFSAGVPGTGWATSEEGKDLLTSGQSVAWATMSQALVLKTGRGQTAQVPANQNMDGGAFWGSTYNADFRGTDIYESTVYDGCGATVYCVGLDIPSSGNPAEVFLGAEPHKSGALANEYFWRTSSHRPDGSHITSPSDLGSSGQEVYDGATGTYTSYYYFYPDSLTRNQEPDGYYMTTTSGSPEDLGKLDGIFDGIAESVVIGVTASTTLGSSAVVKDVVAPQFTVPANASDVKVSTAACTGVSGTTLAFGDPAEATGVDASIEGDTLSVAGFDFSANWCGPRTDESGGVTYDGEKLIIEFKVKAKEGFLGGNDVYTNASAGVYASASAAEPVQEFPKPTVNVPIGAVTATAPDKNVYLLGGLTAEQIKSGATVKCGTVDITDPGKLEDWQKAYVDITGPAVALPAGYDATDDATYTVTATVSPKTDGAATAQGTAATAKTGSKAGEINVFKPELTYEDSEVWYGGDAPASYDGNLAKTEWKHGGTPSTAVVMTGTAPTLGLAYEPETGKISADDKIASKDDVAVEATAKIGAVDVTDHAAFVHTDCAGKTCGKPDAGKFWLHVRTCSLTVSKAFETGSGPEPGEAFVFTVKGGGVPVDVEVALCADARGEVAPVTVSGLPVGSYAVAEDGDWSWRYEQTTATGLADGKIELSSQVSDGAVAFTNRKTDGGWLDFSGWCRNLFGGSGVYDGVGVGEVTDGAARPAAQAS